LPRESEACALGSALVASVHCGHYANFAEAAKHMVKIDRIVEPRAENQKVYEDLYGRYQETYRVLRPLMRAQVK
jgi:sugar (pentulose or hexulose) kinase